MAPKISGKRYSQAIFELAQEHDQLDQWEGDLDFVHGVLQDEEFRALLGHADVSIENKMKAIEAVMDQIHPLVRNMVKLLVSKGLVLVARDLKDGYLELLDEHRGRQRVEVISAVPLQPGELERITKFVSDLVKKEVVVSSQVDESILGGLVIQIGDRLLDGSTRSRLDSLRNQMHSEVAVPGA
ncbi:MAG: ATP synthase F1 subunit delta [SAR202 cluster bacterium Io17-Chloro-G7]|nr:MAG: ATP synthase F1 subunit delta [SAR202 cluster bacterium Io17-Chloro-G7]